VAATEHTWLPRSRSSIEPFAWCKVYPLLKPLRCPAGHGCMTQVVQVAELHCRDFP
jgi:hypothetical protein